MPQETDTGAISKSDTHELENQNLMGQTSTQKDLEMLPSILLTNLRSYGIGKTDKTSELDAVLNENFPKHGQLIIP